ncbi:hypothetical protein HK105_207849 [Polyrhizophydium stewartii]|uniref:Uncharacterized protein n=1 Tax=Polyrhizophydium stewartii TaxID=2732419 RepID=A0ABR4MZI4_9FUNG|nr:hypothetical protein HK105_007460 [Polyrhizophydium stewartii]
MSSDSGDTYPRTQHVDQQLQPAGAPPAAPPMPLDPLALARSAAAAAAKTADDMWLIARFLGGASHLKDRIEASVSPHTLWTARLALGGVATGIMIGAVKGAKRRSVQFLAENAHRLPTTVGGWYFYHRHKQMAMIHTAGVEAMRQAGHFALLSGLFAVSELAVDSAIGQESFLNAAGAGAITAGLFSWLRGFTRQYARRAMIFGVGGGLAIGLAEQAYALTYGISVKKPSLGLPISDPESWTWVNISRFWSSSTPAVAAEDAPVQEDRVAEQGQ